MDPDQDGDGIRDGFELRRGLDPELPDQGPAAPGSQLDSDGDGLTDAVELRIGTNPLRPDTDGDGVSDGAEAAMGLNPNDPDSDGNGIRDGDEDWDGDGLSNADELRVGSNPLNRDTDGDGVCDGEANARGWPAAGGQAQASPPYACTIPGGVCDPADMVVRACICGTDPEGWLTLDGVIVHASCGPNGPACISVPFRFGHRYLLRSSGGCGAFATVRFDAVALGTGLDGRPTYLVESVHNAVSSCDSTTTIYTFPPPAGVAWVDVNGDGEPDVFDVDGNGQGDDGDRRAAAQARFHVDIESDNNSGFGSPDRDSAERALHNSTAVPGKIMLAATFDADGDGIPDYADGYGLLDQRDNQGQLVYGAYLDSGVPRLDRDSAGARMVPLVVEIPASFNPATDRITIGYPMSDPAGGEPTEADPFTLPATGTLRVWRYDTDRVLPREPVMGAGLVGTYSLGHTPRGGLSGPPGTGADPAPCEDFQHEPTGRQPPP